MNILLPCLGGALGAVSRFYISNLFQRSENLEIPLGILIVNILGCFLWDFLQFNGFESRKIITPFFFIGFLGAFTTFSAFSKESLDLMVEGQSPKCLLYISISIFSC